VVQQIQTAKTTQAAVEAVSIVYFQAAAQRVDNFQAAAQRVDNSQAASKCRISSCERLLIPSRVAI
jgi:hypothetical protein